MLRLSKKVEYALLALQYMACKKEKLVTAKEMSEKLNISFEFLSKTLQILMKKSLVESIQGIRGGYILAKPPEEITISDVIRSVDKKPGIVECLTFMTKDGTCGRAEFCTIHEPMVRIQKKMEEVLDATTIADLAEYGVVEFQKN